MKTHAKLFLAAVIGTLFASSVLLAQDAPATTASAGITAANLVLWLTPIITPLAIAGFKKVLPQLPSWTLPILAPLLGMALDLINHFATGANLNLATATLLGLAGVGVREIKDQLTPAPGASPAP